MFEETLLDSSPKQAPVLTGFHWFISVVVGAVFFAATYFGLGVISEGTEVKVLITQAAVVGVVLMFYALMLCYVYADSRHLGFNTVLWLLIAAVLNLVGFLLY